MCCQPRWASRTSDSGRSVVIKIMVALLSNDQGSGIHLGCDPHDFFDGGLTSRHPGGTTESHQCTFHEETAMDTTTIAVDLAKQVFEVAEANRAGRVTGRRRLTRTQFVRFLQNLGADLFRSAVQKLGRIRSQGTRFRSLAQRPHQPVQGFERFGDGLRLSRGLRRRVDKKSCTIRAERGYPDRDSCTMLDRPEQIANELPAGMIRKRP